MRLRVLATTTVTAMLLPLVAFVPSSSALSPRTAPAENAVQRPAPQKLRWKSCHKRHRNTNFPRYARLECATLKAPLDWKKPNGKKITLSISRLKAREKAKGVLFTNPGGPGVPGWTLPLVFIDAGRERLLDQMDIIGIDVRGTGYSTQSSCRKTSGGVYDSRDRGKANVQAMLAQGKKRANACQKHGAKKLPSKYVTTAQTVYDLEWIRRNLTTSDGRKVKKIHWLGYSAGTWLGAHYARRWPKSTGRFVLDSVVDFSGSWQSFYDAQAKSFQARFGDFARWAAGYNEVYGLGGSRAAVLASYERIRAAAARNGRLKIERSGGAEYYAPNDIDRAVTTSLYSKYLFMDLAGLLQDLSAAAKSDAARRRPGAAPDPYAGQAPTFDDIVCNDTPNTRGPKALVKFTAKWGKKYPLTGYSRLMDPCAHWKKPSGLLKLLRPVGKGLPPVLMVNSVGDPATPYSGAVKAHKAYRNSRLVTVRNEGDHTLYAGDNPCVDEIVEKYLLDGVYPRRDLSCPGTSASVPRTARTADRPLNPVLRAWELAGRPLG